MSKWTPIQVAHSLTQSLNFKCFLWHGATDTKRKCVLSLSPFVLDLSVKAFYNWLETTTNEIIEDIKNKEPNTMPVIFKLQSIKQEQDGKILIIWDIELIYE